MHILIVYLLISYTGGTENLRNNKDDIKIKLRKLSQREILNFKFFNNLKKYIIVFKNMVLITQTNKFKNVFLHLFQKDSVAAVFKKMLKLI